MYKSFLTPLIAALTFLAASCGKDDSPAPASTVIPMAPVYVVCEGSLGNGNSALTLYNADSNRATEDVYRNINNASLGDIFQSITRIGDQYFLCINNSDRIVVVNRTTLLKTGSISIPKPRYILSVSENKAFVSSLFGNKIYAINPQTLAATDTIIMPGKNTEGMIQVGNTAYICCWDTAVAALHPVNIVTNAIGAAVPVSGRAPQSVLQDAEGMLWVLSGNSAQGAESKLTRLNHATGAVLKTYSFGTAEPLRPVLNKTRDTLYFIEVSYTGGSTANGIFRMGIHDASLPATAFIPAKGLQYFWGVGIHPSSGYIYVADPVGFTQRGKVYIYRQDGTLTTSFSTGVGPGHFFFD